MDEKKFYTSSVDKADVLAARLSQSNQTLIGKGGLCVFSGLYLEVVKVMRSLSVLLELFFEIDGYIVRVIAENIGFALKVLPEDDNFIVYVRYLQTDQFQRVDGFLTSNRLFVVAKDETEINLRKIGSNGILHSFDESNARSFIYYCQQQFYGKYTKKFNELNMEVLSGNSKIFSYRNIGWAHNYEAYIEGRWINGVQILKDIAEINEYLSELTKKIKKCTELQEILRGILSEEHPLIIFCRQHSLAEPSPNSVRRFLVDIAKIARKNKVHHRKHGTYKSNPPSIYTNMKLIEDIKKYEDSPGRISEINMLIQNLIVQKNNVQKFLRAAQNVSMFKGNSQGMRFDKELMERFMRIVEGVSPFEEVVVSDEGYVKVARGGGGEVVLP